MPSWGESPPRFMRFPPRLTTSISRSWRRTWRRRLGALEYAGFDVPEEHRKGFQDTSGRHEEGAGRRRALLNRIEVDIFIVTTPFQEASFARRTKAELMGRTVTVFTPEDVILYKLIARRPKDLSAIQNILLTNPSLDRAYLADWAKKLGVEERLAESLADAEAFWRGPGP